MAIKTEDGRFKCSFCNKVYAQWQEADACRDSHDLVYVQFLRSDLDRLLKFIFFKDETYLTESMITSIKKGIRKF